MYINNNKFCSNILDEMINNSYYNETLEMMECVINDYYEINYTFVYFDNLNDTYKEKLDNTLSKIDNILKENRMDENYLYDYLQKQNFELENYEGIDLSDLLYDFEDFEIIINYINNVKNNEYEKFLYDLLIFSFESSYSDFINNFMLEELIDNAVIPINNKF